MALDKHILAESFNYEKGKPLSKNPLGTQRQFGCVKFQPNLSQTSLKYLSVRDSLVIVPEDPLLPPDITP